ncbi:microtubule-associated protein futsch, partial [Biomphalaria glabrata]
SMDESDLASVEMSGASQDYPIRTIDLRDLKGKVPDSSSDAATVDESNTSMEVLGAPTINVEEIQMRITDSFSRKMQEWERMKYKSPAAPARDTSPEMERKLSKARKEERQKSKRSREEKEKEKWERQRERDIQKVEREQQKLEKEKVRIEKERLRTLEREAKLEKLKGRLSQSEADSSCKSPTLTSLAEYKVTADFARKLHEWELRKGLSHDVSNSIFREAQELSLKLSEEDSEDQAEKGGPRGVPRAEGGRKGVPPPPLTLQPYWDSPEDTSPVERLSEVSLGDEETCTSVTEECLTKSNIAALERANTQLLENLQQKEMEYGAVQEEVQKVKEKLSKVRDEHAAEMARFHRELAQGNFSGPLKLEVGELESTTRELEERIKVMENFGEKLAMSMESAAVGKWQSIEGEETVHTQLVELVDQMRTMLIQASKSDEHSQKTMALSNFETLYSQAMKLQVQMNNLRLSHLERNREIMSIKRQLLLQEVNNLLLQADITRRETELYQFQEARRFASVKRWNTFSGTDRQRPQVMMELSSAPPTRPVIDTPTRSVIDRETKGQAPEGSRVNIPYMAEEMFRPSTYVGSYMSAPASPTTLAAAATPPAASVISAAGQRHSSLGASRDLARDQLQTLLVLPPSLRTLSSTIQRSSPQARSEDTASESSRTSSQSSQRRPTPGVTRTPVSATQADAAEASKSTTLKIEPPKDVPMAASAKPEITTICDSAPLFREIEELKRVKGKVERGSPTLIRRKRDGPSPAPSPGEGPRPSGKIESPDQTIPQLRSLDSSRAEAAELINDDIFPIKSVMECTEETNVDEMTPLTYDATAMGVPVGERFPMAGPSGMDLPPTSDPGKVSRTKHKLLRRQKEETKLKDYKAISPQGSPIATRGKPPLPRPSAPTKPSSSSSPAPEKSPRSKSLGDVERSHGSSAESKPLQDAINRFEKRATVCETEDRPIELRKTPSPTLHLPRVGLVTRVRRLKPAAELLEESQRYRSGSSIYATRIMPRYLNKDDSKIQDSTKSTPNKENLAGTYVHAIVRRLSRESTPTKSAASSRTNSELSLKRADSPRSQSEFVSQIVRRLSSASTTDAHRGLAPFKDLTNEGIVKKLAQSFSAHPVKSSPDRTLSDSDIDRQVGETSASTVAQKRKSCEVAMVMTSAPSPTSEASIIMVSSMSSNDGSECAHASSSAPTNHQSLPILAVPSAAAAEEASRSRAATYSVPEPEKAKQPEAPAVKSPKSGEDSARKGTKTKSKSSKAEKKGESSRSPERRGTGRGETVGVLCKQSISFDLGVSLYTQKQEGETPGKSRQARSWDPSETIKHEVAAAASSALETPGHSKSPRSSSPTVLGATAMEEPSCSSQGEGPPGSPTSEEKKKRRFLDASWLQISKKFFKASK